MYPKLDFLIKDQNELIHSFKLTLEEHNIISQINYAVNRLGFAILLKCISYLGYVPHDKNKIPFNIVGVLLIKPHFFSHLYLK